MQKQLSIKIPELTLKVAKKQAKKENRSLSAFIKHCIFTYVESIQLAEHLEEYQPKQFTPEEELQAVDKSNVYEYMYHQFLGAGLIEHAEACLKSSAEALKQAPLGQNTNWTVITTPAHAEALKQISPRPLWGAFKAPPPCNCEEAWQGHLCGKNPPLRGQGGQTGGGGSSGSY